MKCELQELVEVINFSFEKMNQGDNDGIMYFCDIDYNILTQNVANWFDKKYKYLDQTMNLIKVIDIIFEDAYTDYSDGYKWVHENNFYIIENAIIDWFINFKSQ